MSGIPPAYFYSRPAEEQTEYNKTSPTSDISDIEVSDGDDSYNPSKNEEINSSSNEIELEEHSLDVLGSRHDLGSRTSSPIQGPSRASTSRTPSPSTSWLHPPSSRKRRRRGTSTDSRESITRSDESDIEARMPSPVLPRVRSARPAFRTRALLWHTRKTTKLPLHPFFFFTHLLYKAIQCVCVGLHIHAGIFRMCIS